MSRSGQGGGSVGPTSTQAVIGHAAAAHGSEGRLTLDHGKQVSSAAGGLAEHGHAFSWLSLGALVHVS